ncbi:uracil-DNA glycosylase family protein [Adhaeretor mobilis]|uniref:Uracil DNA glycosylase superfamily protein n=1 Tax=Adhaeretor mobilis TaxID=1930276 RepID=A0A517N2N9_9BACT|nr:uracil-DNA glycosylase family protein [Adhaeretor mobilis]QDT01410.1 Uracil DNA glycosylase superfamily protein [Adhaeretor mobilis]
MPDLTNALIKAARKLSKTVDTLSFAEPVTHVYNPLSYARGAHEQYLHLANPKGARVLFLGMNPGPWGMAQTGVPFGQIETVRDWLKIDAKISRTKIEHPAGEHPKRPIQGLECQRNEVSGERLWGLFREKFKTPKKFFAQHFVTNYCPLVFMETSGKNRTPDKLPAAERAPLDAACDEHLRTLLKTLQPKFAIGVGVYAEKCLQRVNENEAINITRILHPSPASPLANRGWAEQATKQLVEAGIWK